MHLARLSLSNFRNYSRLELPFSPGTTVITGDNAQGKSNLLEAILFLATTKSFRSASDRELINWLTLEEPNAFARAEGSIERAAGPVKLEILVKEEQRPEIDADNPVSRTSGKRIRVNGLPKRAIDLIGHANVVMFSPQDIEIVAGAPQARRRYLDLTISQVDPRYVRALAHYNRVLQRRNHLLRQLRERPADMVQLRFWDQELCTSGAYILLQRLAAVATLVDLVRDLHRRLAGSSERMYIAYRGSLASEVPDLAGVQEPAEENIQALATAFRQCLWRHQAREIAAGASLFGPHRDDFSFLVDDRDMGTYGSRGQQRTVALALKMAEVQYMRARTGEEPILLLDDILSELDRHRAACVLQALGASQQVLVTAVDTLHFVPSFLNNAGRLHVERGSIRACTNQAT